MSIKSKRKNILLCIVVLVICVSASTIALYSRMNFYQIDDKNAIIINETNILPDETGNSTLEEIQNNHSSGNTDYNSNSIIFSKKPFNPGFEASDKTKVWTTNTKVDIFSISYKDGDKNISVKSNDDNKLIAPGTENSYVFKLKNTGNTALDYVLDVNAYISSSKYEIPIQSRIKRYDGKCITGSADEFVDIKSLDKAYDADVLGKDRYTYYTLEWIWPFETGDDKNDTFLGNMILEEDISFTIEIKTIATANQDNGAGEGIYSPDTGDDRNILLWLILFFGSLTGLIFLSVKKQKMKDVKYLGG